MADETSTDDEAKAAVLTALRSAEPEPLTASGVAGAVDDSDVSDADVRDALRELADENRIERLDEDVERYRTS